MNFETLVKHVILLNVIDKKFLIRRYVQAVWLSAFIKILLITLADPGFSVLGLRSSLALQYVDDYRSRI